MLAAVINQCSLSSLGAVAAERSLAANNEIKGTGVTLICTVPVGLACTACLFEGTENCVIAGGKVHQHHCRRLEEKTCMVRSNDC